MDSPELMQLAWSDKFEYPRQDLLIVTDGMGLYLAAVTINAAALAQGQVRRAAIRWVVCAAAFVAWVVVPVIEDEFLRTEIGFTGTAGLLVALLWLIYRRPHERAEDVPDPGSTEELEAQLAAADEGT